MNTHAGNTAAQILTDMSEKELLRDMERRAAILQADNIRLKGHLEELQEELVGVSVSIAASEEYISVTFAEEQDRYLRSVAALDAKKNALIGQINTLRQRTKSVLADEHSSAVLREVLLTELDELISEREMILRMLKDLKDGIRQMDLDNERIVPYGREQDNMLKRVYLLLKEAQDRMEISIILKK